MKLDHKPNSIRPTELLCLFSRLPGLELKLSFSSSAAANVALLALSTMRRPRLRVDDLPRLRFLCKDLQLDSDSPELPTVRFLNPEKKNVF